MTEGPTGHSHRMFRRRKNEDAPPTEAASAQREGAVLLDVREPDEWEAGHAPGAVHLPLGRLAEAPDLLDGKPVFAICRSGRRSGEAAKALTAAGIEARNVDGGMQAWSSAGLPVVRDDGSPGRVA